MNSEQYQIIKNFKFLLSPTVILWFSGLQERRWVPVSVGYTTSIFRVEVQREYFHDSKCGRPSDLQPLTLLTVYAVVVYTIHHQGPLQFLCKVAGQVSAASGNERRLLSSMMNS